MRRLWKLPFSPRQINDQDPGHEGPSCAACAAYQADRIRRAKQSPMLHGLRGERYKSPHASTYLFEARYSRWACTQGKHGPLDEYASAAGSSSPEIPA
jgi:hypothetical protein